MLSLTPMLQSGDLARTEAWYVGTLGFRVVGRDPAGCGWSGTGWR